MQKAGFIFLQTMIVAAWLGILEHISQLQIWEGSHVLLWTWLPYLVWLAMLSMILRAIAVLFRGTSAAWTPLLGLALPAVVAVDDSLRLPDSYDTLRVGVYYTATMLSLSGWIPTRRRRSSRR